MVVKEFPLYIDCTGPFNKDDYQLEYLFSNYWGEWQGELHEVHQRGLVL